MSQYIEQALSEFNKQQKPWMPFKTWHQLDLNEKLTVTLRATELENKDGERNAEIEDCASVVSLAVGLNLSLPVEDNWLLSDQEAATLSRRWGNLERLGPR